MLNPLVDLAIFRGGSARVYPNEPAITDLPHSVSDGSTNQFLGSSLMTPLIRARSGLWRPLTRSILGGATLYYCQTKYCGLGETNTNKIRTLSK